MKAELTWLSESRETSRVDKSLARFLRGCFQIACVCVCYEFTGDGGGVDGGDCESAANVNGETIRRGPRQ